MNESIPIHAPLEIDLSSECSIGCLVVSYSTLVIFLGSLPFHFCYLASIIKFNGDPYFKEPFFALAVSLGIADLAQSFVTWLLSRLIGDHLYLPALLTVSWFFLCAQVFGVLWISFDRFTAIVNPEKHAKVWKRSRVIKLIILQWALALIFTAPSNLIEISFHLQNTSVVSESVSEWSYLHGKEFAEIYYALANLLFFMIIAVVLLPVLFIFIAFKVWHHKSPDHYCCEFNSYECTLDSHEFRLAFVATIYMLMLALSYVAEFIFLLYDSKSIALYLTYCVMFDIFNISKPFVCLALSAPARLYFLRFVRCQPAMAASRRHSRVAPHRFNEQQTSRI